LEAEAFIIAIMIFTTTATQLPGARLSQPALLAVSVLHIALLWLLLQTSPVQRVVKETVVMLNLPITQPLPKPPPKKVITLPKPPEPIKPIKPIEKPVVVKKTITPPVEPLPIPPPPPKPPEPPKPVEKPVVLPKPPEKVVEVKTEVKPEVKPVEVQVPKEVVKEVVPEAPKVVPQEVPKPVVAELPPTPTPAPAPVAPAAVPAAEPAKAAAPAPVASVPAAPLAPAVAPPAGPNRPISAPAAPVTGGAPAAALPGSGPPPLGTILVNPLGAGGTPATSGTSYISRGRGGWNGDQLKQASDKLLNPKNRVDNLEIDIQKAGKEDCLHPTNPGLRNVARLLNGDCPK
jgi:hypothetical protein